MPFGIDTSTLIGAALGGPVGALAGWGYSKASSALSPGRTPDRNSYNYTYTPNWAATLDDAAAQKKIQGQYGDLYSQAMLEAQGKAGPSVAEQQMAAGQSRAAADAASMAASARGGPAAMVAAQRQAMEQQQAGQQSVSRDAGVLRAQERQAALGRALAANQAAAANAGAMRGASIDQERANMQAARWQQEGGTAYDQNATAADQAYRKRNQEFWGRMLDNATGVAVKGASGGLG